MSKFSDEFPVIASTDLDPVLLELIELFERSTAPEWPVKVRVVDRDRFNAFAAIRDDGIFIGLDRRVPGVIQETARAMASHGASASFETRGLKVEPASTAIAPHEILEIRDAFQVPPLADPDRERVGREIYRWATLFMLYHELAHHARGHLRYINTVGRAVYVDGNDESAELLPGYRNEALEWDADEGAAMMLLDKMLQPAISEDGYNWQLVQAPLFGTLHNSMELLTSSMLLGALFWQKPGDADIADPKPRRHPHPEFRLANMIFAVDEILSQRFGLSRDAVRQSVLAHFRRAGVSWQAVFPDATLDPQAIETNPAFLEAFAARHRLWKQAWADMGGGPYGLP